MNVYDTANKLAGEIKQSEEYMNYKMAKQALSLNSKLKEQLQEFEKIRYEVQDVNKIIGEAISDVI